MNSLEITVALLRGAHTTALVSLLGTLVFLTLVAPAALAEATKDAPRLRRWLLRVARITSAAARSPERTAPSTQPHMTAELSVPAQWIRPQCGRSAWPNDVSTPGGAWLIIPPPE